MTYLCIKSNLELHTIKTYLELGDITRIFYLKIINHLASDEQRNTLLQSGDRQGVFMLRVHSYFYLKVLKCELIATLATYQ